ncbi:MAG: hypothetical protein NTV51_18255 [Verrucomicrobia bacterium]|nr:hypothetical protein [Verrucomicrobiota bacterium]
MGPAVVEAGATDGDAEGRFLQVIEFRDAGVALSPEERHVQGDVRHRVLRIDDAVLGLGKKRLHRELAGDEPIGVGHGGAQDAGVADVHLAGHRVEDIDRKSGQLVVVVQIGIGVVVIGGRDLDDAVRGRRGPEGRVGAEGGVEHQPAAHNGGAHRPPDG